MPNAGRLMVMSKTWLQHLFNLAGYKVERLVSVTQGIDVFDLAVRKSAIERGKHFFFVQIGANDGKSSDPIRSYVAEYHWSGLLVEPQPRVFDRLKENYASEPNLRFVNAAISRENGRQKLYSVATDCLATRMASFDRELLAKQLPLGTPIVELEVPAITLQDLLTTNGVDSIDLLQIDVEGYDFEVVKMIDFEKWRPTIIHYEHRHLSMSDRTACEELLAGQGYRLHLSGVDTTAIQQQPPVEPVS